MSEIQDKTPSRQSAKLFANYVSTKPHVGGVEEVEPQIFAISRTGMADLKVFLTNIYIVGEADVHEITSEKEGLDAIVTVSAWNSYTNAAKQTARRMGIGLFELREFMGAIYSDGERFLDYVHPDDRERAFPADP